MNKNANSCKKIGYSRPDKILYRKVFALTLVGVSRTLQKIELTRVLEMTDVVLVHLVKTNVNCRVYLKYIGDYTKLENVAVETYFAYEYNSEFTLFHFLFE